MNKQMIANWLACIIGRGGIYQVIGDDDYIDSGSVGWLYILDTEKTGTGKR